MNDIRIVGRNLGEFLLFSFLGVYPRGRPDKPDTCVNVVHLTRPRLEPRGRTRTFDRVLAATSLPDAGRSCTLVLQALSVRHILLRRDRPFVHFLI